MHNFSSMVKYLLGTHMKQALMVTNLGLTSYDKEKYMRGIMAQVVIDKPVHHVQTRSLSIHCRKYRFSF